MTATQTKRYQVRALTLVELPSLAPLLLEFAALPEAGGLPAEQMAFLLQARVQDPSALVLRVDDTETGEAVGFLAAYVLITPVAREVFIPFAYVRPGIGLAAGRTLQSAVSLWARAQRASRIGARTTRLEGGKLAEPMAWGRLGYREESVLLYCDV